MHRCAGRPPGLASARFAHPEESPMLDASASGVYVIAPTPFHDDGRIDERSTDRMTDFFLESGVTGITVLGQMGEAPKLDHQEALDVASRVIRRAASLPVVV